MSDENLGNIYATMQNSKRNLNIESDNINVIGQLLINGTNSRFPAEFENSIRNYLPLTYGTTSTNTKTLYDRIVDLSNSLLSGNNDASFNNVDVSGSLNVQGEKVMTVPSLDICGNDLSANTTYEITTGPSGNINNISFVKKEPYYISANIVGRPSHTGDFNNFASTVTYLQGWTIRSETNGASNNFNVAQGTWTCPVTGIYQIYLKFAVYDSDNRGKALSGYIYLDTTSIEGDNLTFAGGTADDDYRETSVQMTNVSTIQKDQVIRFRSQVNTYNGQTLVITENTTMFILRVS